MRPPLAAVLGSVLFVALLAAVGAVAAPPPTPLCATCDSGLEDATGMGSLDVYLDEDGDSEWVERVPVESAAAEGYRDDPERLEAAVDEAWAWYHVADGDRTDRSIDVDAESVVVTYSVEDVARPGAGDSWIVDYFYAGGTATRYHVGAERMTVHPPEGSAVTNRPSGAEFDDGAATWHGENPGMRGSDFDQETFLTYGPGGASTTVASYVTIATMVGPTIVRDAAIGGIVPALVLGVGAMTAVRPNRTTAIAGRLHARAYGVGPKRLGRAIAGVGLAGVVLTPLAANVLVGDPLAPGAIALLSGAAGYAALGAALSQFSGHEGTRVLLGAALTVAVACGTITWAVVRSPVALAPAAFALSSVAFLPLGYVAERGGRVRTLVPLVLAGPFVAVAVVSPMYVLGLGTIGTVLYGVLLLPTVALVVLAGYPLSVLGRQLAAEPENDESP